MLYQQSVDITFVCFYSNNKIDHTLIYLLQFSTHSQSLPKRLWITHTFCNSHLNDTFWVIFRCLTTFKWCFLHSNSVQVCMHKLNFTWQTQHMNVNPHSNFQFSFNTLKQPHRNVNKFYVNRQHTSLTSIRSIEKVIALNKCYSFKCVVFCFLSTPISMWTHVVVWDLLLLAKVRFLFMFIYEMDGGWFECAFVEVFFVYLFEHVEAINCYVNIQVGYAHPLSSIQYAITLILQNCVCKCSCWFVCVGVVWNLNESGGGKGVAIWIWKALFWQWSCVDCFKWLVLCLSLLTILTLS